ncbi:MAG: hypothetical protein H6Q74_2001 [Firmicutes bacterium]|nr:hypothetical protein [Bacillota bacterium]
MWKLVVTIVIAIVSIAVVGYAEEREQHADLLEVKLPTKGHDRDVPKGIFFSNDSWKSKVKTPEVKVIKTGTGRIAFAKFPAWPDRPELDYFCSIKRVNNERIIAPGLSYIPGEGLSFKLRNQQETVQLQRSMAYASECQVFWKKKY